MPSHEIALPAGSKNLSPALPTITRHSKDGGVPVIRLFAGDNFIGDVLEGSWLKGQDNEIAGPFTVIIDSGQIELEGKSHLAADADYGWINGQNPFLILQNSHIDVHMKIPSATPANTFNTGFILRASKSTSSPTGDSNLIVVDFARTSTPIYRISVRKKINASWTTIYSYHTVTNQEGTFRIKFRPDDGKLDVYFHDGGGDIVESTDELTLSDDTLDLTFTIAYPAFSLETYTTTLYSLISEKIEVSYPDFDVNYDLSDEVFQGEGSELLTKAFDTSGNVEDGTIIGATWMKDGKYGKALHFDGATTRVDIPSTTYDLSAATFTWWSKRDSLRAAYPDGSMAVFGGIGSTYRFIIFGGNGNLQLETNTNADVATGVFTDDVDVWHHYAVVCDNYVVTMYEDGIDITTEGNIADDVTFTQIGRTGTTLHYEGLIDDVRIYDSVLTQANVQAIMADNPPAGAIREWLFDGGNTRGDVVCYDTRGETDESLWQRVYTEDHEFSGNCVMENGLIRVFVNEANQYGTELYYWDGSMWSLPIDVIRIQLASDAKALVYPFLKSIVTIDGAEKIQIHVRVCDSSDENSAYYLEYHLSLIRGSHHLTFEVEDISLEQNVWFIFGHVTPIRWAYCGDVESKGIGDYDFLVTVSNNVMTDNFMLNFDDALSPVLGYVTTNEKPAAGSAMFHAYQGGYIALSQIAAADFDATKIHCGLAPFRKIANLFTEAEDGTLADGATADHFEDGFDVDSSGEYEGDISNFTWDTGNSRIITVGTAKTMIRVDNLEWGAGTYEHKWTPKHAQASGSLVFCADRNPWPTNPCDPLNGYTAKFSGNTDTIYLYRLIAGNSVLLDSAAFNFVIDVEYKITVHCHESAGVITVDIDDVQKLSVSSETTFTSGACGFGNATIVLSWFDSLSINAEEVESSGNSAVMMDSQNEKIYCGFVAITDLPVGRYLAVFRLKDTAQIASDGRLSVYNYSEAKYVNEEGAGVLKTLTADYAYYTIVFDVNAADDGDTIGPEAKKATTGSNTIACDYVLIIPIGDGESFPQDIAHSALRSLTKKPKLVER